jgi:hypothetical protein
MPAQISSASKERVGNSCRIQPSAPLTPLKRAAYDGDASDQQLKEIVFDPMCDVGDVGSCVGHWHAYSQTDQVLNALV